MDIFASYGMMFQNFLNFLLRPIPFGNGISVSILGVSIGVALIGLFISAIRKLFD